MYDSNLNSQILINRIFQRQSPTLFLLGVTAFFGVLILGWFSGEPRIQGFFTQVNALQMNPPSWLELPAVESKYLLIPTVGLLLIVSAVMKISPQPKIWSRRLVVGILIILMLRYVLWRSLSTLNLADPLNGVFSLGLFFLEMLTLFSTIVQLVLMLNVKERHSEANEKSLAVITGSFTPSVDILIPTYNEPEIILRRTIIGCQALDYTHKKIYLLDDGKRLEVKELAEELGCYYITRPDNSHAKAGNLNHAIAKTSGELIVVFDADFIPTKNFLTRTVGFFQDEKIALVQTPQSFYNADPIARNLGLENVLIPEEEIFYRQIQPIRDAAGSVICAGTSFVVRRHILEVTGGFVTESLSEDYFTAIRISALGHHVIYLNEKLSAGLAAENMSAHATQRLRWAQGTLQAFFIKYNPLTIPGLNFVQRLAHLEGILSWFNIIARVYFLFMPLTYSFLGVIPIKATAAELLVFFLPFYLVNLSVFAWLNNYARSALLSDIYSIVLCFPLAINIIQVMLNPFSQGFKVTPKGIVRLNYIFNWKLAFPLILLFLVTAVSLWQNLCMCIVKTSFVKTVPPEVTQQITGIGIGWMWSAYNLVIIGIALLILLDAPKSDMYEWFDLRRVVSLTIEKQKLWGVTTMLSEIGAEVALTQNPSMKLTKNQSITIEIAEENLCLSGEIIRTGLDDEFATVRIKFDTVNVNQHRRLVEMLFCRPGQWKRQNTPGELSSLLLILRILLKPRILFDRKVDIRAIAVSKI
ncbi:glycosyltransferase [Anabaena subtropica FACHB-260]|uniref:Glycosyltransferase n=1 Tax=Anabaena subtropica FACHB-260 TaxID=2692884 RepID=A0ABR8CV52_9NOST|nr:glycosyltransferase [Anabaena subtropica FACHB-260]